MKNLSYIEEIYKKRMTLLSVSTQENRARACTIYPVYQIREWGMGYSHVCFLITVCNLGVIGSKRGDGRSSPYSRRNRGILM